ncbi:MAG: DUF3536 domain-containing protein [Snowella sp.]|nr:DUF3536 domain-containing protein [Snowella sp.]
MTAIFRSSIDNVTNTEFTAPLKPTETGVYVTIHGHFYQPPRENPYLNVIERQPSATPFHDWNERIHHECYRPNAFARILNDRGELLEIVNNFEYLSFNIGPTLMSWLEGYDPETYQRIIDADRKSCDRLNGHGNAIAQVYNHIILPLANKRDKYTQIRWGKADFKTRFGREPEGIWLAETAVDYETLEALIDENIRFIILAPSQAERCRPFATEHDPEPEWHEVGGGQIDPTRPYRCFITDGRSIDIFFYDGPISRDMGFNDVLSSSEHFAGRLGQAVKGDHRPAQIISVATDGETFGHHKGGTEKCLAYAFTQEFVQRGWTVTNFAHYLSVHPPQWEVELKPVTAWSCFHGVERWQDDCGCGGGGSWHQKWRKPLRESLNWLRDQLKVLYLEAGRKLFGDPWQAREDYIQVILQRSPEQTDGFLTRHQNHVLADLEKIDALRLLEMQRLSLLMFTSCGWFFDEISRPEGVQILRYAARAMELAAEVTGIHLEDKFIRQLAKATSNVEIFKDGEAVYQQLVTTAQISFEQVAAHYAISSLFTNYAREQSLYCYQTEQLDYQKQQLGTLTLAVGQVKLTSSITWESHHFTFAVLHLGGWDFHCCIQPFAGRSAYSKLKEQVFDSLKLASAAQIILNLSEVFGNQSFNLQHLFAEERHRIMQLLTDKTKKHLDQLYTQVYRDNYSILVAFQRDELPVPPELQVAAEIAIAHRCATVIANLEASMDDSQQTTHHLEELKSITAEAAYLRCRLTIPEAKKTLERLIFQSLQKLLYHPEPQQVEIDIRHLIQMSEIAEQLQLGISLAPAQELYYDFLHQHLIPDCLAQYAVEHCPWTVGQLYALLELGRVLAIDVSQWLT